MTAKEYKQHKGLRKENLRDNMDNIELILSEESTKRIALEQKPQGLRENIKVAHKGGNIAKIARDELEKEIGKTVITTNNKLNYKYIEEKKVLK